MGKKGIIALVVIVVILVIIAGVLLAMKVVGDNQSKEPTNEIGMEEVPQEPVKEEKTPQIYRGNNRPVAKSL